MIANRRFTDLYTWGKRSRPPTLAAEIQYQLLPPSLSCEAAQFALPRDLEPSENISGDTFDYSLDRDTLHLSVTDPMGHDINAALTATLLVGALRGARRAGADLTEQARQADQALPDHGQRPCHRAAAAHHLHTGRAQLVNAGHPWPLRLREGAVEEITCEVDHPFGLPVPLPHPYRVPGHRPAPRRPSDPAHRRHARTRGAEGRSARPAEAHPAPPPPGDRADHDHRGPGGHQGRLDDDATVMCLDWHGPQETHRQVSSGADVRQASPGRPSTD